jgi:hypothetical protein
MYTHSWSSYGDGGMGMGSQEFVSILHWAAPFLVILLLWSLFWKGLALWHSAGRGQYWWFVILLLVNTIGILEIIYLFLIAKLKWRELFSVQPPQH